MEKSNQYAKCNDTPRRKFVNEVSDEVAQALGKSYRLLPLYESDMFERAFIDHYSLKTNANLGCRWKEYRQTVETRVYAPFELSDIKQLHFYNCKVRYLPSESTMNREHRKKLRPGPGVDYGGQMPIPQEALMQRNLPSVKDGRLSKKAGNEKVVKQFNHASKKARVHMKKK